jgi:hypothetical protein
MTHFENNENQSWKSPGLGVLDTSITWWRHEFSQIGCFTWISGLSMIDEILPVCKTCYRDSGKFFFQNLLLIFLTVGSRFEFQSWKGPQRSFSSKVSILAAPYNHIGICELKSKPWSMLLFYLPHYIVTKL